MIGTITRLALTEGCHALTVVTEEGIEYHCCTGDAYPLLLVTYSDRVGDLIGKRITIKLDEHGSIKETRSIEGHTAHQIHELMENRTFFLDPTTGTAPGFTHHIIRKHNEGIRRKCDKRTNLLKPMCLNGTTLLYYFVVDHGLFETATGVWLGSWPPGLAMPDTDSDTIATVAHLRRLGGIARAEVVPPKAPEPPALVCAR